MPDLLSAPGSAGRAWGPIVAWLAIQDDATAASFYRGTSERITLDGSIFLSPVKGQSAVWAALAAVEQIYEARTITAEAVGSYRAYLEWTAIALGQHLAGVTILALDEHRVFTNVTIYHQPLAAVLSFSAELRRRLRVGTDPSLYYRGQDGPV
jgi:hypothetical protein